LLLHEAESCAAVQADGEGRVGGATHTGRGVLHHSDALSELRRWRAERRGHAIDVSESRQQSHALLGAALAVVGRLIAGRRAAADAHKLASDDVDAMYGDSATCRVVN
jgi:hypothetical protein